MSQFNSKLYSKRYYKRHLVQYREWENAVGRNIVEILHPSSILDLGCGVGSYLEGALFAGCKNLLGIDISHDVAKEFFTNEIAGYLQCGNIAEKLNLQPFDCVMSFESAEHIDPKGTDQFIKNLTELSQKYIVFTAAPPGQRGTGHINCREKKFWINEIQRNGFIYHKDLVDYFVSVWTDYKAPNYILKNLMVFQKHTFSI